MGGCVPAGGAPTGPARPRGHSQNTQGQTLFLRFKAAWSALALCQALPFVAPGNWFLWGSLEKKVAQPCSFLRPLGRADRGC